MPDYLTLSDFKGYLKVDHVHEDALLVSMLDAAESYLGDPDNGILGRPVSLTSFVEHFGSFQEVALAHPDNAAITSIGYTDTDGAPQTLGAIYELRDGCLHLNYGESWPSKIGEITVSYDAGWATIPKPIVEAGYYYASAINEARVSGMSMPSQTREVVAMMIAGYRRIGL